MCFIFHGENGKGTARAPALNDPALLSQFNDRQANHQVQREADADNLRGDEVGQGGCETPASH